MAAFWNHGCQRWLLNQSAPPPRWLGLEPGEAYLGCYPRVGVTRAAILGMISGATPALAGALSLEKYWVLITLFAPALGIAIALAARLQDRVYLTNKALVLKEHKRYRIIHFAQVDGVSFGEHIRWRRVRVHYSDAGKPGTVELVSHCPRQTAEELSQLIAQYGGGKIAVSGGKR